MIKKAVAKYKHLPIYKLTYELLGRVIRVVKKFPRDHKHTLGEKIKVEIIEIVVLVYRANASHSRVLIIEKLIESLEVVGLLMRASYDLRIISQKDYASLIEMTESIGRQAMGWKKSEFKKEGKNLTGGGSQSYLS